MQKQIVEDSSVTAKKLSVNELISLMDVYLSEWEYRDKLLWSQVYKFFYANILVLFLELFCSYIALPLLLFRYAI